MILFLLPFLFSPFNIFASWLPTLYLAVWPILIKTAGRETLISHALVLILFILTCDITRRTMLKLIGFDLISLPVGIALLAALVTDKGTAFLTLIHPLFSGLLMIVEPIFLMIELYLVMDIIKKFNRWMSDKANIRDEESHDLASWEPPLARGSIVARFFVIFITILSYIGVYIIIQESKSLLGSAGDIPVHFNHAIAALVTLQLIAFSATVYKEEGILSESALVALMASVPIFIASWSYYHLKEVAEESSASWWSSYFPFSIFAGSSSSESGSLGSWQETPLGNAGKIHFEEDYGHSASFISETEQRDFNAKNQVADLVAALEESINRIERNFRIEDSLAMRLLLALSRRLIMLINSILGLSLAKLASFYFGPDICYILAGRLGCLLWLAVGRSSRSTEVANANPTAGHRFRSLQTPARFLRNSFFFNKWTLVKLLLVLAYTQTLLQQLDNKQQLIDWQSSAALTGSQDKQVPSCCGQVAADFTEHSSSSSSLEATTGAQGDIGHPAKLKNWFNCMWTSAKACHHLSQVGADQTESTWSARLMELLGDGLGQLGSSLRKLFAYTYDTFEGAFSVIGFARLLWLARWRSPIIQRLVQSMLVQVYYIANLLLTNDDDDDSRFLSQ